MFGKPLKDGVNVAKLISCKAYVVYITQLYNCSNIFTYFLVLSFCGQVTPANWDIVRTHRSLNMYLNSPPATLSSYTLPLSHHCFELHHALRTNNTHYKTPRWSNILPLHAKSFGATFASLLVKHAKPSLVINSQIDRVFHLREIYPIIIQELKPILTWNLY